MRFGIVEMEGKGDLVDKKGDLKFGDVKVYCVFSEKYLDWFVRYIRYF